MKKASILLIVLFLGIAFNGFSQAATPKDFYAGKWEITLTGTPNGDARLITSLVRKDGKLTGELADATDANKEKMPITKVEESPDKIAIFFTASTGDEVSIDLDKADGDNLKGSLMGMFEAKAKRMKN